MISEELRKYIDMVEEQELNETLYDIVVLGSHNHGIDNVIIYIGKSSDKLRIRVSIIENNIPLDKKFVIRVPNLDYDAQDTERYIPQHTMKKIIEWISTNEKLLFEYEHRDDMSSSDFLATMRAYHE